MPNDPPKLPAAVVQDWKAASDNFKDLENRFPLAQGLLQEGSVTSAELAEDSVGSSHLQDLSVQRTHVANGAINSNKLGNLAHHTETLASAVTLNSSTPVTIFQWPILLTGLYLVSFTMDLNGMDGGDVYGANIYNNTSGAAITSWTYRQAGPSGAGTNIGRTSLGFTRPMNLGSAGFYSVRAYRAVGSGSASIEATHSIFSYVYLGAQ